MSLTLSADCDIIYANVFKSLLLSAFSLSCQPTLQHDCRKHFIVFLFELQADDYHSHCSFSGIDACLCCMLKTVFWIVRQAFSISYWDYIHLINKRSHARVFITSCVIFISRQYHCPDLIWFVWFKMQNEKCKWNCWKCVKINANTLANYSSVNCSILANDLAKQRQLFYAAMLKLILRPNLALFHCCK